MMALLLLLLPLVGAGQQQLQHEALSGSHRALLALNRTCYQLCKAGKLPAPAPAASAPAPSNPSTASASPSSPAPSVTAPSTACSTAAAMDPATLAMLLQRRQAAKLALTSSDFFEVRSCMQQWSQDRLCPPRKHTVLTTCGSAD